MRDMDMNPLFFPREEKEPKLAIANDRWRH
jgi:hypothetical protein